MRRGLPQMRNCPGTHTHTHTLSLYRTLFLRREGPTAAKVETVSNAQSTVCVTSWLTVEVVAQCRKATEECARASFCAKA